MLGKCCTSDFHPCPSPSLVGEFNLLIFMEAVDMEELPIAILLIVFCLVHFLSLLSSDCLPLCFIGSVLLGFDSSLFFVWPL